MKNLKKGIFSILASVAIVATHGATAFAATDSAYATTSTAICVGVDYHEKDGNKPFDYTPNAKKAKEKYNTISGMTALYTSTPTKASLNVGIKKNVVFLNSHGNYNRMKFVNEQKNPKVYTGISTGVVDDEFLNINNVSLSNVKLISFVGCKTADDGHTTNITSKAVSRGAATAVGFSDVINSTHEDGKKWLETYNDCLAQGMIVYWSMVAASEEAPTSDLVNYVRLKGNPNTRIAPQASSKNVDGETQLNISIEFEPDKNMTIRKSSIEKIVEEIKKQDPSFDYNQYKMTQNIICKEQKYGLVKFDYYINGVIKTDKSYIVAIEKGIATKLLFSLSDYRKAVDNIDEKTIITKKNNFREPESIISTNGIISKSIEKHNQEYIYRYKTNTLTYLETVFYDDEGVIVSEFNEVVVE